jgi:DNA-binding SARP family transcriptional activator/TolB-like protein
MEDGTAGIGDNVSFCEQVSAAGLCPQLRLTLFGPMRAQAYDGHSVLPRMRKTRALLAVLGLAAGRPVARTQLIDLLWSRRGSEQGRASLRQATHELQWTLGSIAPGLLRVDRDQITLRKKDVWVDAVALTQTAAAPHDLLSLFCAPLLEDLRSLDPALDRFLADQHQRLVQVAETIGKGLLNECRDNDEVLETAERLLKLDPGQQYAWHALISTHLKRGERQKALAAFERCHAALAQARQGPPSPAIQQLVAQLPDWCVAAMPRTLTLDIPSSQRQDTGNRPRLAVMPLRALDLNRDEGLAVGLTAEIITALTRFRWMSCVTAPLLTVVPGEGPRTNAAYRRLDLDFVLEGSVQRSGDRARVITTLSNVRTRGEVVWARRFDRNVGDLLAAQEGIGAEVAAQIDLELLLREPSRQHTLGPDATTSRDLLARAMPGIYHLEASGFRAAGEMLEAALAADPANAAAHAWSAYWHLLLVGQGWAPDPAGTTIRAMERAQRAVILDPTDARALTLAGHIRGFLGKRAHEAKALHERAIALNPNLPLAWCFSGLAHSYLGDDREAIRRLRHAHQLSPHDPHSFFFDTALIMPFIVRGEYDNAVELGRRAIALNPGFSSAYKVCLSALGHLRRFDDAADIRARLLALEPGFSVTDAMARSPMSRDEDIARYAEGLRRAGLPE